MISASSRAKRIFRGISRFTFFADPSEVPDDLPLAEGEDPIGIYLNSPPSLADAIVITSSSLITKTGTGWLSIPYQMIVRVVIPVRSGHLEEVRQLTLALSDGMSLALPVQGGTARTADAFEFARFLDRVRA